jgi:hypothetical protein
MNPKKSNNPLKEAAVRSGYLWAATVLAIPLVGPVVNGGETRDKPSHVGGLGQLEKRDADQDGTPDVQRVPN